MDPYILSTAHGNIISDIDVTLQGDSLQVLYRRHTLIQTHIN